jgi:hypothetical protein
MTPLLVAILLSAGAQVTGQMSPTSDVSSNRVKATGSTTSRALKDRWADVVNVKDFGAKGDGVTDDSGAFAAAFADLSSSGGRIYVPRGTYYVTATTNLDGKRVTVSGDGAGSVVKLAAGVSGFTITNHDKDVQFREIEFDAAGANAIGIDVEAATTSASAYRDLTVERCTFRTTTYPMIGVKLVNARESFITDSHFVEPEGGGYFLTGVYLVSSVNVSISRSTFLYAQYGVHAYGTPIAGVVNPFDVGPSIDHSKMLGCLYGVVAEYNDYVGVSNSVIDYCDHPIVIYGSQSPILRGNYISSQNNNPAIQMIPGSRFPTLATSNVIVDHNDIIAHDSGSGPWTHSAVYLTSVTVGSFDHNNVTPYRGNGLTHDTCTHLGIDHNSFIPEAGYGTYSVVEANGATSVRVFFNLMGKPSSGQLNSMVDWNRYVNISDRLDGTSTAKGATLLTAGNTSVTINPGIGRTPNMVVAVPSKNVGAFWVDNFGANSFRFNISAALGQDVAVYWFASTSYSAIQPQP